MKKLLLSCLLATSALFAKAQNTDIAVVNNTNCLVSLWLYEEATPGTCTTNPAVLYHVPPASGTPLVPVTICTNWFSNQVIKVDGDDGSLTANPPCTIISPKPSPTTTTVDLCGGNTSDFYYPSTTCSQCSGPITITISTGGTNVCGGANSTITIN